MRFHVAKLALAALPVLAACQDGTQSPQKAEPAPGSAPAGSKPSPVDLVYICGNKFLVINATPSVVQATYRVAGTRESGGITLREGPGGDPGHSETELETTQAGVVELFVDDVRVAREVNEGLPCGAPSFSSAAVTAAGSEATMGKWTAAFSWPVIGLHVHLLPNGKVLSWGKFGTPYVWDPSLKTFTSKPVGSRLFCSGHAFLADGRLLVSGGHIDDRLGLPDANLFKTSTMSWSKASAMARGRWYPTNTVLGNGEVLTIAGTDQSGTDVAVPEVWTGTGWRKLSSAGRVLPWYPRTFLAPNGKIFYAGEKKTTYYLSTVGTGSWSVVGDRRYGVRDYGSAVMYQPGRILYAGGGRTTATAEIIDLTQAAPAWKMTDPMAFPRRHLNATILPDGKVLVTGGSSGTGFSDEAKAIHAAELWDPSNGHWTTLASNTVPRVYHSTSLLLKDGRVLHTGSGDANGEIDHYNAETFSPPYLFQGARPTISSAPSAVNYRDSFLIGTPDPAAISRVTWIRLGSVTHAFDMNQRFVELSFQRVSGALKAAAPTDPNLAPPGHYLLFILNAKGVPSVARIVRIT